MTTRRTALIHHAETRYLQLEEGCIAYDDTGGDGPLALLVPGVGDLRAQFRHVTPALVDMGYRVVRMDLRGFGDSDATFTRYDGQSVGDDIVALLRHLDARPAVVMGNSIAAGSAVYVAAEAPELVCGIVLIGGFTRGPALNPAMRALVRVLMAGPWRNAVWMSLYDGLFAQRRPADHEAHRRQIRATLRDRARSAAMGCMMVSRHDYAAARYASVQAPSLFVMGTRDSDFPDPVAEATEVAAALGGGTALIEGAGHYPHVEAPGPFMAAVRGFLEQHASARAAS